MNDKIYFLKKRKSGFQQYFIFIFQVLFFSIFFGSNCIADGLGINKQHVLSVSITNNPVQIRGHDKNSLSGMNTLYWIDDDKAWEQQGLGFKLQYNDITTLRFPGGEVADNYDWELSRLENSNRFPKEPKDFISQSNRLDYLEFLEHAKKINANNLFFVVNLEGAFLAKGNRDKNILRYAKKAARWVKAVKQQGYKVKYWEIGNESYLQGGIYPLTSQEYAKAVKVFYKEMKNADSSIKIGIVGPEGLKSQGFASSLTNEQLSYFRHRGKKQACKGHKGVACRDWIQQIISGTSQEKTWWEVVLRDVGNSFDFIVIHDYGLVGRNLHYANHIKKIRNHVEKFSGRNVEIAITEWNVPNPKRVKLSEIDVVLQNSIKLGNYMASDINQAVFWPLRYKKNDYRALLSFESLEPTLMYKTFEILKPVLSSSFVKHLSLSKNVYFLQTNSKNINYAVFVNRSNKHEMVYTKINNDFLKNIEMKQVGKGVKGVKSSLFKMNKGVKELKLILAPKTVTVFRIQNI